MKFKTETMVGLLVLVSAGLFVYSSIRVTGWQKDAGTVYKIFGVFENVSGLAIGSTVSIAGIKVGKVEDIELVDGQARVGFSIQQKYKISNSSWARVQSIGILGDKYLEVFVGNPNDPPLLDGDQILFISSGATLENLMGGVSQIVEDVKGITRALNKNFGADDGARLDEIMENLRSFTGDLEQAMSENRQGIKKSIKNFSKFSEDLAGIAAENREDLRSFSENLAGIAEENREDLRSFSENLAGMAEENRENLRNLIAGLAKLVDDIEEDAPGLVKDLRVATQKLDKSLENLESITAKIDKGEGTIGKLVNDEETVDQLNQTLVGLNQFLDQANRTALEIGFQGEYISSVKKYKSYVTLNIRPARDHYYILQLISSPDGSTTRTETNTQTTTAGATTEENEDTVTTKHSLAFSLQIAKRYHDSLFRIGLFENTFGLGFDQYFGAEDQFKLYAEAWDFSREQNRERVGAHVKLGGSWRFYENFYFVLGGDDLANKNTQRRGYFVGLGLSFNEDNLKYIAGSLPVGQLSQ